LEIFGLLLVIFCCGVSFLVGGNRYDNYEELRSAHKIAGITGVAMAVSATIFAAGFGFRRYLLIGMLCGLLDTGGMILLQQAVAMARFGPERRMTTMHRMKVLELGLVNFRENLGDFPTENQGFEALLHNPGIKGWAGPYIQEEDLIDGWKTPFRYKREANRILIISFGRDRIEGTEDDGVRELDLNIFAK
jgi:hypothetical protein